MTNAGKADARTALLVLGVEGALRAGVQAVLARHGLVPANESDRRAPAPGWDDEEKTREMPAFSMADLIAGRVSL